MHDQIRLREGDLINVMMVSYQIPIHVMEERDISVNRFIRIDISHCEIL